MLERVFVSIFEDYRYHSTKSAPYVYKCVNIETGQFYIGYRRNNKVPSDQDFPSYRTSSGEIKQNFNLYEWNIIAEFFSGDDAYDFEQKLIYENWGNPLLLNKSCFFNKRDLEDQGG